MKQRPSNSRGDRQQFSLATENLHQPTAGKLGQVHGATLADGTGRLVGGSDARAFAQQLPRMDKQSGDGSLPSRLLQFIQAVGVTDGELGDGRSAKRRQMCAAAQALSHIVGYRPHVGAGRDAGAESRGVVLNPPKRELFYLAFSPPEGD